MRLEGKVALVTGASRGIGKGCALAMAREGADLIVNSRPGSPDLEAAADEIRALGRKCTAIPCDVFSRAGCETLVAEALKASSRIDILVSNPALSQRKPFLEFDPDDFDRGVYANLNAGFHLSQLVARHMVERGGRGKIVFMSSVHAIMPIAFCTSYNAAKAGLNHMARTIAVELFSHRINVNVIEPGWIDTEGERKYFKEDTIQKEGLKLPWGRLGTPDDIGRSVVYLCSDDADYVTGEVLRVDGGFWMKDVRGQQP